MLLRGIDPFGNKDYRGPVPYEYTDSGGKVRPGGVFSIVLAPLT